MIQCSGLKERITDKEFKEGLTKAEKLRGKIAIAKHISSKSIKKHFRCGISAIL
jgi:hypothetical protein